MSDHNLVPGFEKAKMPVGQIRLHQGCEVANAPAVPAEHSIEAIALSNRQQREFPGRLGLRRWRLHVFLSGLRVPQICGGQCERCRNQRSPAPVRTIGHRVGQNEHH